MTEVDRKVARKKEQSAVASVNGDIYESSYNVFNMHVCIINLYDKYINLHAISIFSDRMVEPLHEKCYKNQIE
jgi:hypothetical protein